VSERQGATRASAGTVLFLWLAGSVAAAETVTVSMKDRVFHPDHVNVSVGDTVQWINDDTELHQVISGRSLSDRNLGAVMNSGTLLWNQGYRFTFTKAGVYPYMCVIHRSLNEAQGELGMVGEIVVHGE
jgi:plastocyanin